MRILLIIWLPDNYPLNGQIRTSIAYLLRFGTSSGKNRIFSGTVLTRSFGDVYQRRNRGVTSIFAMTLHAEDTLVSAKPQRKSYKVSFTGPLCSKTLFFLQVMCKQSED